MNKINKTIINGTLLFAIATILLTTTFVSNNSFSIIANNGVDQTEIISNPDSAEALGVPTCGIQFTFSNGTGIGKGLDEIEDVYQEDTLNITLFPSDNNNSTDELSWELNVVYYVNSTTYQNKTLINNGSTDLSCLFTVPDNLLMGPFELVFNYTVGDGVNISQTYFYFFDVANKDPIIDEFEFTNDGSVITPNVQGQLGTIKRGDVITIKLNVSDFESTNENLNIGVSSHHEYFYNGIPDINGTVEFDILIPLDTPLGITNDLIFNITDQYDGESYYNFFFIAGNVAPEIEFAINGYSNEDQLSFNKDDIIVFGFNITDLEADPAYVYIKMLYIAENGSEGVLYFSTPYVEDINITISVRVIDIPEGEYIIYAYVVDADGKEIGAAPLSVGIYIDDSTTATSTLLLAIGLIVGLAIGIGATFIKMKGSGNYSKTDKVEKTEKKKKTSKPAKKTEKKSDTKSEPAQKDKSGKKPIRKL